MGCERSVNGEGRSALMLSLGVFILVGVESPELLYTC